jgi:hypothetical protein
LTEDFLTHVSRFVEEEPPPPFRTQSHDRNGR